MNVIQEGYSHRTFESEIRCKNCGALAKYIENDICQLHSYKSTGQYSCVDDIVICKDCGHQIIVNHLIPAVVCERIKQRADRTFFKCSNFGCDSIVKITTGNYCKGDFLFFFTFEFVNFECKHGHRTKLYIDNYPFIQRHFQSIEVEKRLTSTFD